MQFIRRRHTNGTQRRGETRLSPGSKTKYPPLEVFSYSQRQVWELSGDQRVLRDAPRLRSMPQISYTQNTHRYPLLGVLPSLGKHTSSTERGDWEAAENDGQ